MEAFTKNILGKFSLVLVQTVKLNKAGGGGKVSKSHGRATVQKISDFAQNLEICMRNLKKYAF